MKTFCADRPFLKDLGRQLREAVGAGAALAALGVAGGCGADAQETADAAGNAGTSGTGSAGATGTPTTTDPVATMDPYPLESLGCFGPISENPLYGPQCCFEATCYTPANGGACAVEPTDGSVPIALPPGSGTCGCSVEEDGRPYIAGPYASNPGAPEPNTPGRCCYVVGSVGCTGRPFVVGGLGRLAGIARRDDWGLSSRAGRRGASLGQG